MRLVRWMISEYRAAPAWFWIPLALTIASCVALAWWSTLDPVGLPDWSGACTFPR